MMHITTRRNTRLNNCIYTRIIISRGEEKKNKERNPKFKARCWTVEATQLWMNRFTKLLATFEK